MIRAVVVALGALMLAGAACIAAADAAQAWPAALWLGIFGALIILSVFFERHYRGARKNAAAWQPTGERFIDPTTGTLTEVRYDPQTGERAYVPIERP